MNRIIREGEPEYEYRSRMMAACPSQGEIVKFMTVRLEKGARISKHAHVYHTVLYYPELAEPVTVTPQPGTMLYLPPGTQHEVPIIKKPRLSIALLIEEK